jgi:N-acetylglucosamine kinase-like BadF-type ATPase
VLGFDGGGTKTECVIMSSSSELVTRVVGGPSNASRIGVQAAVCNVVATADAALTQAGLAHSDVSAIGAGLAGTADTERRELVGRGLEEAFPNAKVMIMTDLDAALASAPPGAAIVLVAGTGSAAIGRNARGQMVRVGGYGRFSSDEGSAFDVGRQAIAAAIAARDNDGSESRLGTEILRQLACTDWHEVQRRAGIAADDVYPVVFPVIAVAADAGDEIARDILLGASNKLIELAFDAAKQLGLSEEEFTLIKIGGMLGRSNFFDAQLSNSLRLKLPRAREGKLRMSPAEAAALAAKEAYAAT